MCSNLKCRLHRNFILFHQGSAERCSSCLISIIHRLCKRIKHTLVNFFWTNSGPFIFSFYLVNIGDGIAQRKRSRFPPSQKLFFPFIKLSNFLGPTWPKCHSNFVCPFKKPASEPFGSNIWLFYWNFHSPRPNYYWSSFWWNFHQWAGKVI